MPPPVSCYPPPMAPASSPSPATSIDGRLADWRELATSRLGDGVSFDDALVTRALDGMAIQPLYTSRPSASSVVRSSPSPESWAVAQQVTHPVPRIANDRALDHLANGATGLGVALGSGGQRGVAARWLPDLDTLFDGVHLDAIPLAFSTGADTLPLACAFAALCEERGVDVAEVRAHFGTDPIAALARDGALPGDLADARREATVLAAHSRLHWNVARSLAVDAGPWHDAGAHAALELALAAASFVEMLRWLDESGLPPAAAHAEFVWRFDVTHEIFTEIAKLRAARALHAKLLGSCGIEQGTPMILHATTSRRSASRSDPWTNMLRLSYATLAAAAGGADLVTSVPFDECLAGPGFEPSGLGERNARNVQLVLAHESHLDHVVDPARGSFFVESRTESLIRSAWEIFQEIERNGGAITGLRDGSIHEVLDRSARALTRRSESDGHTLVGASTFQPPRDAPEPRIRPLEGVEADERDRSARIAARGTMVLGAFDTIEHGVRAAKNGATFDEIGGAFVRGAPETLQALPVIRECAPFEEAPA